MSNNSSVASSRLEQARTLLAGAAASAPARDSYFFSALQSGVPKGALTQISSAPGSGKTRLTLRFLAEQPQLRTAWIEELLTVYPCAFPQHGVNLERILFIETGEKDFEWTVLQAIRSRLFGVIVLNNQNDLDSVSLRRTQIAAEQSGSSVIFLSDKPLTKGNWPLSLQIHLDLIAQQKFRILKGKRS